MFDASKLHPLHIDSSVAGYSLNHAYVCAVAARLSYLSAEQLSEPCANTGLTVEETIDIPPNFCIVLRSNGVRIIAFRGTDKRENWRTNLQVAPVQTPWGRVHKGFYSASHSFSQRLTKHTQDAIKSGEAIWISGHSLGGAIAMLVAQQIVAGKRIDVHSLYTFGQPPTGYPGFNRRFQTELHDRYFRFVNHKDTVVHMSALGGLSTHAGALLYFDRIGKLHEKKAFLGDLQELAREMGGLFTSTASLFKGKAQPWLNEAIAPISCHPMQRYLDLLGGCFKSRC